MQTRVCIFFGAIVGTAFLGCGRLAEPAPTDKSGAPEPETSAPSTPEVEVGGITTGGSSDPQRSLDITAPGVATFTLFGGSDGWGHNLDDTWEWREKSGWIKRQVLGPSSRSNAAMASLNGKIVLFGGIATGTVETAGRGDTWEWNGQSWSEHKTIVGGPSARWGSRAATLGSKVVLFGGYNSTGYLSETWEWDGTAWTERKVPGAPARTFHAMAAFNDKIVLYGGQGDSGMLNDTWEWDGSAWTERDIPGAPEARNGTAMATLSGKLVLFGGGVSGRLFDQTWEWSGTSWTERKVVGPSGRVSASMATGASTIVLFGGNSVQEGSKYVYYSDTWAWDGNTWTQRTTSGPVGRTGAAMAAIVLK